MSARYSGAEHVRVACTRHIHTCPPRYRASIAQLNARYPQPSGPVPIPESQPSHMKRRPSAYTSTTHPLIWKYEKTPASTVPEQGWRIYRLYLQHMRLIPDPHVWRVMVPRMRKLCAECRGYKARKVLNETLSGVEEAKAIDEELEVSGKDRKQWEEARLAEMRVRQAYKNAKKEVNQIRAAVACHPHALERLLQEAYGQRGAMRWDLIYAIQDSSPPLDPSDRPNAHLLTPNRPSLPPALQPLAPPPIPTEGKTPRARTHSPPNEGLRKAKIAWNRERTEVQPSLALPRCSGVVTGWEDLGVVDCLRTLSGLHERQTVYPKLRMPERVQDDDIPEDKREFIQHHQLETFQHLSKRLQAIFPIKLQATRREPPYPVPPPSHVRETPGRWSRPRAMTPRLMRRTYQRLFDSLNWVKPAYAESGQVMTGARDLKWVKCSFEQFRTWESGEKAEDKNPAVVTPVGTLRWAAASEKEVRWIQDAASHT